MFTAVLILILLTELIIYAVQVGVFEQRKSANEMRQKEAFHIADSAIQLGKEFMLANSRLVATGQDDVLGSGNHGWMPGSSNPRWRPCADADLSAGRGQHPCFAEPADNDTDFRADLRANMYFYMDDPVNDDPDVLADTELPVDTTVLVDGTTERVALYALLCMLDIDRDLDPIVQGCTTTAPADWNDSGPGEQDKRYFMITLLARGESECDGGTCNAQALIADKIGSFGPGSAEGGPGAPLTTKNTLPDSGSTDIVPNPNGGGVGVPISVWIDSSADILGFGGSWQTCERHEFYGVDIMPADYKCPDPSGNCTCQGKKQLSYAEPGAGNQHLDIDMVPDDNFPPDLFKWTFGVEPDADGLDYVMGLAEEIVDNCDGLDQASFGLIWVTGSCRISSSGQIGTPDAPVFLVMAGSGNRISGSPDIFGTVMVTDAVVSPNGIDGTGSPTIYGALVADASITQFQGNLKLVYVEDILENVLDLGNFGAVAGAWSDFHDDWR